MRDNPSLAGKPIAVGGSPERRGVVATCNYEARKYGIHSAMAATMARSRCPELIIIRPDMQKYRDASALIHKIFERYTKGDSDFPDRAGGLHYESAFDEVQGR